MAASALSLQRLARSGLALAILLLALPAAGATAPAAGAPEGEDPDIPGIVLGSVVDGSTLEFQNPFTGSGVTIELPRWAPVNVLGMEMDFSITRHLVILWVAALLLIVGVNLAARKRSMVPKGFYSFIETFVVFVRDELAVKNIGKEHADRYVPFLCTAFFLILLLNLLGLVPYSATATGNIAVTAGLALCTFGMTLIAGMRGQGVAGFWLGLVPKGVPLWLYPIMVPVELLGLVTKPFALSVRLFANMSAGGIIIGFLLALIFMLGDAAAPFMAPVSVAFAAGIYLLKLFVAFLQAYIFTMLSALFIGMASHPH